MMDRPTDGELDITQNVLAWLEHYYRDNEPYATNTISVLEAAQMEIPLSSADLG